MIDQYSFLHFAVTKDKNPFFFLAPMGVKYDDALEALEEIKAGVLEQQKILKENYEKQQQEKLAAENSENKEAVEATVVS